nr:BamA/TamA family outer membrane protein [Spirochaeta sp.]
FGGAAIFFYGPDVGVSEDEKTGRRNNTAAANAIITTNGSYIGSLSGTNYLAEERYRWDNAVYGNRAPGIFFGIGDDADEQEAYTAETIGFQSTFSLQVKPDVFVGPLYQFEGTTILETEDDGLLAGSNPPTGADGTTVVSGAGVAYIRDTTGGVFWPESGSTSVAELRSFSPYTGSSTTFGLYRIAHTHYISTVGSHVLALQGRFRGSWGNVPFQHLPAIGGDGVMRGLLGGRYRDTIAMIVGAEYRIPLSERFAVVGFGSVGQVGESVVELDLPRARGAGGIGFRIALNKEQRLNLRIDIAVSPSGVFPYVNMGEAY